MGIHCGGYKWAVRIVVTQRWEGDRNTKDWSCPVGAEEAEPTLQQIERCTGHPSVQVCEGLGTTLYTSLESTRCHLMMPSSHSSKWSFYVKPIMASSIS